MRTLLKEATRRNTDRMFGLFQRLRRRLGAELDAMIRHVENHEALVASAVRELEASIAHTERERGRAATTHEKLRATLREERDAASSWRDRALRETVEARGIECLRRSKRCERRVHDVDQRLGESLEREARLRARGDTLRANLAEFREQEALLRERQSTAHAVTSLRNGRGAGPSVAGRAGRRGRAGASARGGSSAAMRLARASASAHACSSSSSRALALATTRSQSSSSARARARAASCAQSSTSASCSLAATTRLGTRIDARGGGALVAESGGGNRACTALPGFLKGMTRVADMFSPLRRQHRGE